MNYGKKNASKKQKEISNRTNEKRKRLGVRAFKICILCVLILGVAACAGMYSFVMGIIDETPEITAADVSPEGYTTFIYDQEGNQLETLVSSGANRVFTSLDEIPEDLQNAFIAIEDSRFETHNGIDPQGIVRAALVGLTSGNFSEGASTITQQLIKNSVFSNFVNEETTMDSVTRKIQEITLALELEQMMSKDQILENYLNMINLGQNTLGVQSAATRYFDKDVSDLTLSECAVIAGITKNPTGYNPITYPEENAERRQKVLEDMASQGYITQEEYDEAMADTTDVYNRIQAVNDVYVADTSAYSYFTDAVIDEVVDDLMETYNYTSEQAYTELYSGGLSIYVTQDASIQAICDEEMSNAANYPSTTEWEVEFALTIIRPDETTENYSKEMFGVWAKSVGLGGSNGYLYSSVDSANSAIAQYKETLGITEEDTVYESYSTNAQPQASVVIIDQTTGYVKAIVGGRGEKTASLSLNRATDSQRQPGSTFKIVSTYAPGLDTNTLTLADVYVDEPITYTGTNTSVTNSTGSYRGSVTVRTAIEDSINTVAVKAFRDVTSTTSMSYLQSFGFDDLLYTQDENGYSDTEESTALGGLTYGVTAMEMTTAYASLANGGTYTEAILYTKVLDHNGNIILDNTVPETHTVVSESTAALITDAMVDVVQYGTGTAAKISGQAVAGKTGTTNDKKDLWFVGYTNYYTAGVWGGYDSPVAMTGSTTWRVSLWQSIMERIHSDLPDNTSFTMPSTVVQKTVCTSTGLLAVDNETYCCPSTITEYFAVGTVPTTYCTSTAASHIVAAPEPEEEEEDPLTDGTTDGTTDGSTGGDSSGGSTGGDSSGGSTGGDSSGGSSGGDSSGGSTGGDSSGGSTGGDSSGGSTGETTG